MFKINLYPTGYLRKMYPIAGTIKSRMFCLRASNGIQVIEVLSTFGLSGDVVTDICNMCNKFCY